MSGLFYFKIRCMTAENIIITIRNELIGSISILDGWFDKDDTLIDHKPAIGGWCVREVLEHVMLINRFLLNYIDQGSAKAMTQLNTSDIGNFLQHYNLENQVLAEAGVHKSLDLNTHDHTVPTGRALLPEVRREIREQLDRCLIHLELLKNGEGILFKTSMAINGLAKLDVYQNIYFLALHVKRHLFHLETIMEDYDNAFEKA